MAMALLGSLADKMILFVVMPPKELAVISQNVSDIGYICLGSLGGRTIDSNNPFFVAAPKVSAVAVACIFMMKLGRCKYVFRGNCFLVCHYLYIGYYFV